ncbi:MAG TPA: hypothetical protein VJN71_00410 [Nitrososphaerales archaeon]|nr:hypothetical protein [Nitrososphaerales archaeon]
MITKSNVRRNLTFARFLLLAAGSLAIVFGARTALSGYNQRILFENCVQSGTCPVTASPIYLQSALGAARLELDAGIGVVFVGALAVAYAFFMILRKTNQREGELLTRSSQGIRESILTTYAWFANRTDYLAVLVFYILLTIAFTWPLAANFTSFMNGSAEDVFHELWVLHLASTSAYGPFFLFFTGSNLYPNGIILYYQVLTPFNSLLFLPLSRLFGEVVAYNLLYTFTFYASGFTTFVLVNYITKNKYAALFAGIAFGFAPIHTGEGLSHLNIMSAEFVPLYAYFLLRMVRERKLSNSIYAAVAVILNAMCDLHMLVLVAFITGGFLIYWAVVQRKLIFNKPFISRFALMSIIAILIGVLIYFQTIYGLFFAPIAQGAGHGQTPLFAAIRGRSSDLLEFIIPSSQNPFFQAISRPIYANFHANANVRTYIGYTTLGLSIVGLISTKEKRQAIFWLAIGALGFLMALGPYVVLNGNVTVIPGIWQWFYFFVPFFESIRTPYRFDYLLALGVAVLSGYGVASIMTGLSKMRRNPRFVSVTKAIVITGLCLLLVIEFYPAPYPELSGTIPQPYYTILAADHSNYTVIEVPMLPRTHIYDYYQSAYNHPLLNGRTSRNTLDELSFALNTPFINQLGPYAPNNQPTKDIMNQSVSIAQAAPFILAQYNIKYIIVHKDLLLNPQNYMPYLDLLSSVLGMPYYQDNQLSIYKFDNPSITGLAQLPRTYNVSFYSVLTGQWYRYGAFARAGRPFQYYGGIDLYSATNQNIQMQFTMAGVGTSWPIQVFLNGQMIGTYQAKQKIFTSYETPFLPFQAGLNQITFYSPNGCGPPNRVSALNPRSYSKSVLNCASGDIGTVNFVPSSPSPSSVLLSASTKNYTHVVMNMNSQNIPSSYRYYLSNPLRNLPTISYSPDATVQTVVGCQGISSTSAGDRFITSFSCFH